MAFIFLQSSVMALSVSDFSGFPFDNTDSDIGRGKERQTRWVTRNKESKDKWKQEETIEKIGAKIKLDEVN